MYEYNRWVAKHHLYQVIQLQALVRSFVIRLMLFFCRVMRQKCACVKVQSVVRRMLTQRLVARIVLQIQIDLVNRVRVKKRKCACVKVQSLVRRMLAQRLVARIVVQIQINLAKRDYRK